MAFIDQSFFSYFITLSFILFFIQFSAKVLNNQLFWRRRWFIKRSILSKRWNNCRQSNSWSFLMSLEKKLKISTIKTDRRIARKVCKRKSVFKSFENSKAIKAKTTLFDNDKSNFNINDCDEELFDLILVWLVFDKAFNLISTIAIFAIQNELILKHNFFAFLIIFRNSDIVFRIIVQIFFTNDLKIFRLSN